MSIGEVSYILSDIGTLIIMSGIRGDVTSSGAPTYIDTFSVLLFPTRMWPAGTTAFDPSYFLYPQVGSL